MHDLTPRRTLAALALAGACVPVFAQTAQVTGGAIAGASRDGVDAFLGIPFAAAPVGDLRWRAPQSVPSWPGVRAAQTVGSDCMQDKANNPLPAGYENATSEDCLYLNAWRPHGASKPLPVMVWIHGGAFIMGSGSLPIYDGTALAKKGVLLVTLNYRLGRFGTYAHPLLSAFESANQARLFTPFNEASGSSLKTGLLLKTTSATGFIPQFACCVVSTVTCNKLPGM